MSDLPDAHFGTADSTLPAWRGTPDSDPDDEEMETPKDVVMMLGFDPADDDTNRLDAILADCDRLHSRMDAIARKDGGE